MSKHPVRVVLLLLIALCVPSAVNAQDTTSGFPISVLNCQTDPGQTNPSSGKVREPGELENKFGCSPAVGVGVTVYNLDLDFQAHCVTDEKGLCSVDAPGDPERKLMIAEHTAMLESGFAPRELVSEAANYSEYAGVGIVNLPTENGTPVADTGRVVLTVTVSGCDGGQVCDEAAVLGQVSPADITSKGAPWLATDTDGQIAFDIGSLNASAIDLMFNRDDQPDISCTDAATGEAVEATWLDESEGTFYRITPVSSGDVNCDVIFS